MKTSILNRKYGWHPSLPDHRDQIFLAPFPAAPLPPRVDLRGPNMPPVYDQGNLGSCTANAIAAAIEFDRLRQKLPNFIPSRLFIYYNERALEGTIQSDAGAQIRDGIKSVAANGDCPEPEWPYVESQFAVKPTPQCYADGVKHTSVQYQSVLQSVTLLRQCLAAGFPFVFGFTVYESFESPQVAQTGVANLPAPNEECLGGHAVMAVGYDTPSARFIVRNSWGVGWGQQGYFTLPFSYVGNYNLASDFWTVRLVK